MFKGLLTFEAEPKHELYRLRHFQTRYRWVCKWNVMQAVGRLIVVLMPTPLLWPATGWPTLLEVSRRLVRWCYGAEQLPLCRPYRPSQNMMSVVGDDCVGSDIVGKTCQSCLNCCWLIVANERHARHWKQIRILMWWGRAIRLFVHECCKINSCVN